jgi:hypothetical protein
MRHDDAFGFSTSLRWISPGLSAGIYDASNELSCLAFNLSASRSPEDPVGSFGFGLGGALIFPSVTFIKERQPY